ncbi:MAG: pseudouridine synthase [Rhodospirillaceae bacterium]|nr:pseudouridine synthase [Rhodospirillaceae bacterium]
MNDEIALKGERVAKHMARAGLCSRRDGERWIAEGRVKVDGKTINTPATIVDDPARISVDGNQLGQKTETRVWRYHKPPGLVTTHKDDLGRATVFQKMPQHLPRVISVGRLDLNTEGLLLMTNDGELARRLELPATGWKRKYRVRIFGYVDDDRLKTLEKGVTVDGIHYGPIEARLEKRTGSNAWLSVILTEGKNREIRRVIEHLGLKVSRLIRTDYGPFKLGNLTRGAVMEVSSKMLADQLGANLDGDGPIIGAGKKTRGAGWAKAKPKAKTSTTLRDKARARAKEKLDEKLKEKLKAKSIARAEARAKEKTEIKAIAPAEKPTTKPATKHKKQNDKPGKKPGHFKKKP